MAKITANNIFASSITSDKLDSSVASNLATANNANVVATIASTVAAAAFSTANNLSSILANSAPIITSITIADSSYNALDDTAANTTGGFCIITGSGFVSTPTVVFGTTSAPAVSFISSTTLRVQIPALTAASYPVYVVNSNGGTAIRVNGVTTSSFPAWSTGATLSNQIANTAFGVAISATSDSNITYSNTSALPAGTTLLSNGWFYGTVTIGAETTYSFDVKATDVELQDTSRTFGLTVILTSKRIWRTGYNNVGQMGTNDKNNLNTLTQMGSLTDWEQISAGGTHCLAVKQNGTLWGWGGNGSGQLGINDRVFRSSPVQIGSSTNWSRVSTGGSALSLGVKTDGTLWSWGVNNNGQLGLNEAGVFLYRSSPTQVGVATNWNKVSAGPFHSLATKTNGTLWSWGNNAAGGLGLNTATSYNRSSPTQVGVATNWNLIATSVSYAAAVIATKTDGTLWTWGYNLVGSLGTNDRVDRSSPTQIGSLTNWNNIDIAHRAAIASRTDGRLFAWGRNENGELGVNDRVYRSSPTQVGASTDWNLVGMGTYNAGAIKTNGTLWLWGRSSYGQIASGGIDRSSPVQIGSATNWVQLNTEGYASWAIALN